VNAGQSYRATLSVEPKNHTAALHVLQALHSLETVVISVFIWRPVLAMCLKIAFR